MSPWDNPRRLFEATSLRTALIGKDRIEGARNLVSLSLATLAFALLWPVPVFVDRLRMRRSLLGSRGDFLARSAIAQLRMTETSYVAFAIAVSAATVVGASNPAGRRGAILLAASLSLLMAAWAVSPRGLLVRVRRAHGSVLINLVVVGSAIYIALVLAYTSLSLAFHQGRSGDAIMSAVSALNVSGWDWVLSSMAHWLDSVSNNALDLAAHFHLGHDVPASWPAAVRVH